MGRTFQRYIRSSGRWAIVKTVLLRKGPVTLPAQPDADVEQDVPRARVKAHVRVRAILTQTQAGTCYLATRSDVAFS
jgi:hypothetical protein